MAVAASHGRAHPDGRTRRGGTAMATARVERRLADILAAGVVGSHAQFPRPRQVLGYLARYTHRVAISNRRLVALDDDGQVSFRWKDYRASGRTKPKVMHLPAGEFMRRFLLHVL